ncbi:hypothetical protein NM688_g3077 [Phlebia brevispora]|uniref:Uncharacterized protein n=1 Tax=Phlebia brevispora TaxID=194682 RepID=A0ACC1T7G2_9APHY|nr:hypothetical protein NM688_g3077 [Phlebia brevispora]
MTFEWKPEQILLLTRTLDALPSHLLTPFNGPVPPSNLLDKLARGVAKVKNPVEWPHSIRATRAKIVELARIRAKEVRDESASDTIVEEESDSSDVPLQQTTNIGLKRTLHRQSSMDFMQSPKLDLKNNVNLSRLSRRLQRTERMLLSPTYDIYDQTSPSLRPSTPSSLTLNSELSDTRPSRMLRRSTSSMSNDSDQFMAPSINPSVRRLRRSDTFAGSTLFPTGLKRAPSYGGSSRNSLDSVAMSIDFNARDSDITSDEEEKLRTNTTGSASAGKSENSDNKRPQRKKSSFQRHSSILGPELPNPQPTPQSPAPVRVSRTPYTPSHNTGSPVAPASPAVYSMPMPSSPYNLTHIPSVSVSPQVPRTLRRSSRPIAPLPRTAFARKISFNNIPTSPGEGAGSGAGLGSAFQMH